MSKEPKAPSRPTEPGTPRSALRQLVRGTYDLQKLRISMGNRVVGQFKAAVLGQGPGESEKTLEKDARKVLDRLREDYERITDGIATLPSPKKFRGEGVISSYTELVLADQYFTFLSREEVHFRRMGVAVQQFPLWDAFFADVRGCGPAMAGVILSEIDIHEARYPSSIFRYAGLDVARDGKGRSSRKEHQVEVEYVDKHGETQTKMSLGHNRFLKTKLTGVLGPSFLKSVRWVWANRKHFNATPAYARRYKKIETRKEAMAAAGAYGKEPDALMGKEFWQVLVSESPYATTYYDYKHRLANHPDHKDKTLLHRHNMAIRFCVKAFLTDLYNAWRPLEGLPVSVPYSEAKLDMEPHQLWLGGNRRLDTHDDAELQRATQR